MTEIAKFDEIDIRDVWPHEASDFTPWLAENLDYLSEALEIDLELEGTEVDVGAFSVDIVAIDMANDRRVIVENQLEATNHDHLGKLLTYAAGIDRAAIVVWIAKQFRPEHMSALRWLNEQTVEGVGFFGLKLEAVRIAGSPVAVRLDRVVQPDSWSKRGRSTGQLTPRPALYLDYWTEVLPVFHERFPGWSHAQIPQKDSWFNVPSGRSGLHYAMCFRSSERVCVELYLAAPDPEEGEFDVLQGEKADIESRFGGPLSWERLDGKKASRVAFYGDGSVEERERWPELKTWMLDNIGRLRDAVQHHVDQL